MSRARPIDAARWEEHRKEISELYECKKLKDVRQIMFEKYGFEASQSQYERQVRKWNLKKTHTGEEWAALSARCRNRIGKGSEFYYRGKLIDTQRAQRVLWRHGYISTIERVTYTQVEDSSIPSGFTIRTPPPEYFVEQVKEWCSKLPFALFTTFLRDRYVCGTLTPRLSLNPQLLVTPNLAILDIMHTSCAEILDDTGSLQNIQTNTITQKYNNHI